MKKILMMMTVIALSMTFVASTAMAQDGEDTRTKFYNFDDMLIDGQFKKPDIMKEKAREKAGFKRLSKLKKGFLGKLKKTSNEQALQ